MPASGSGLDAGRCVVHVDVDAFYAQCEELRNPSLKDRPLGVTQKYLIVTSNYPARRRGITKLMGTVEAKQKCPELVLVSGEDLTPYRHASKQILAVLQRFGVCERGGMDEMLVDVTSEAQNRLQQGFTSNQWAAHVHSNQVELVADNKHRPQDLRTLALRGVVDSGAASAYALCTNVAQAAGEAWAPLLMAGCVIAQEMRAVLKAEVGFRCSAGIASNRMLAKLVSGIHKPDDQTVLLPPDAAAFVGPLPVRAMPGVGYKMEQELTQMNIKTAAELRLLSKQILIAKFGDRTGTFLYSACRGVDASPVQDKGPPKSITVEDSFKSCSSMPAAEHVINVLAPDLLARMVEDQQETGRHAGTLTLKWRHKGQGWTRSSTSCPVPQPLHQAQLSNPAHVSLLATTLITMLKKNVQEPFQLTLLNVGVTNFVAVSKRGGSEGWNPAFAKLLQPQAKRQKADAAGSAAAPSNGAQASRSAAMQSLAQRRSYGAQPSAACISKSTERALMEQGRGHRQAALTGPGPSQLHQRHVSDDLLGQLDFADEEEQGEGMWQEEEAWQGAPQLPKGGSSQATLQPMRTEPVATDLRRHHFHRPFQDSSQSSSSTPSAAAPQLHLQEQPSSAMPLQVPALPEGPSQAPQPRHQRHAPLLLVEVAATSKPGLTQDRNRNRSDALQSAEQHSTKAEQPGLPVTQEELQQSGHDLQQLQSDVPGQESDLVGAQAVQHHGPATEQPSQHLRAQTSQVPIQQGRDTSQTAYFGHELLQPQSAAVVQMAALPGRAAKPQQGSRHLHPVAAMQFPGKADRQLSIARGSTPQTSSMQQQQYAATSGPALSRQSAGTTEQGGSAVHTEESDRELALRLQQEEDALQRQRGHPPVGRFSGARQSARQPSGTLHAFFKKA